MEIRRADFADPRLVALLAHHHQSALAAAPPESGHALDLDGLQTPGIAVWTAWDGDTLAGVGALKTLDARHGEVKSMHTAQRCRRRGAGAMLLTHVIAEAQAKGILRLSLETGSADYFAPARALYARHGFVPCAAFPPYRPDPHSVFLTLDLETLGSN